MVGENAGPNKRKELKVPQPGRLEGLGAPTGPSADGWVKMHHSKLENSERDGNTNHLTCLFRNLYAGQEAIVRTGQPCTEIPCFPSLRVFQLLYRTLITALLPTSGQGEVCQKSSIFWGVHILAPSRCLLKLPFYLTICLIFLIDALKYKDIYLKKKENPYILLP